MDTNKTVTETDQNLSFLTLKNVFYFPKTLHYNIQMYM